MRTVLLVGNSRAMFRVQQFFVPEFTLDGSNALARAIRATVRQSEANLDILRRKRSVALTASVLLLMAAVVVTYARLAGPPGFALSSYGTLVMWGSR